MHIYGKFCKTVNFVWIRWAVPCRYCHQTFKSSRKYTLWFCRRISRQSLWLLYAGARIGSVTFPCISENVLNNQVSLALILIKSMMFLMLLHISLTELLVTINGKNIASIGVTPLKCRSNFLQISRVWLKSRITLLRLYFHKFDCFCSTTIHYSHRSFILA